MIIFQIIGFSYTIKVKVISKISSHASTILSLFITHNSLMSYPFDKPSGIQKIKTKDFFKKGIA